MATDSIMGLFQTPEQYQLAQQQAQMEQARQFATMTPGQQVTAQLYQAGGQLGRALGSPDPLLQRQAQRNALIKQVNMSDPASLRQAIQASASDPELSSYLLGKYKELTGILKEQSVITKNENWQAAQADAEKKRNVVAEVEDKLSRGEQVDNVTLNKAKLAFGDISRPKTFQQADGTIVTVPPTVDNSMFPNIGKFMSGGVGGGSSQKAGVITTPASQEAAVTQAETAKEAVATVQNAINKVDEAAKLYSSSKMAGGFGQMLAGVPMTDARSLANLTANIKAAFSVEEIAKLKAQSKTGATGFGSLAVKELETIQNAVTALDPADKKFPEQLKTIRESFDRWKKLMEQRSVRAEAKAGGQSADVAPKPSAMAGRNPQLQPLTFEQKVQRTMGQPQNKGKSRAEIEAALRAAGHN